MSSPVESILREQPCPRPVLTSLANDQEFLQEKVSFSSKHHYQVVSPDEKYEPRLVDKTLNMLLGSRRIKKRSAVNTKKLEITLLEYFKKTVVNVAAAENSSIRKMLANVCFATNKELEGCCYLISSHSNYLRQQILLRHLKSNLRGKLFTQPTVKNLDPNHLDVDHNNLNTNPKTLISTLKKLPSEWYVLQVTAEHEHLKDIRHRIQHEEFTYSLKPTHGIHLVVLPTGKNAMHPICINVPRPNVDSSYDIRTEIENLLNNNKANLTATYRYKELYWKMRKKQNDQMNVAIWELEYSWLREWRVLFLADHIEHLDLVKDIHDMIDKLIADSSSKIITERTRWLLKKIATGACYLRPFEVERAVKYVLPTQSKLAKNIILSILAKAKMMDSLKNAKRKTLILILDECLDFISFESMQLLSHQPVTRLPSLHILYALFKQHEDSIQDGYKIIRQTDNFGTFIVNPSLDLVHMEVRMKTFLNYWLPKWEGVFGIKPDIEIFKNALTNYELLMYNGHGSGIQFLKGEEIERMRVVATVLLFGCSSIKLLPLGGRQASYGVSNQYLMACSPCILGMLWEVTDGDIDRMTAEFISIWIPSKAKAPWSEVCYKMWSKASLKDLQSDCNRNHKPSDCEIKNEQDMLTAVAKSKNVCKQFMTSAAIIVRGLPIKLVS